MVTCHPGLRQLKSKYESMQTCHCKRYLCNFVGQSMAPPGFQNGMGVVEDKAGMSSGEVCIAPVNCVSFYTTASYYRGEGVKNPYTQPPLAGPWGQLRLANLYLSN